MAGEGSPKCALSRRDFLKRTALGGAGLTLASSLPGFPIRASWSGGTTSRVVLVTDQGASFGSSISEEVVQVMMDRGIMELTDEATVGAAWRSLFPGITPASRIGIKINCINRYLSSHPEVAYAIAEGLASMEVGGSSFPRNNIIIWDRYNYEITNAGYTRYTDSDPNTVRCFGTNQSGYGPDYDSGFTVLGNTYYPSSILTKHNDYLINLSVLKNHTISGMTMSLKNHYGSINYPAGLHGYNHCDPQIAELNKKIRDQLGSPQVVSICDAIFGIFSGGPMGYPQFIFNGILLSKDPVALDYQGKLILENQGCQTTGMATYIATAAGSSYNLGTDDPQQIEMRHIVDPTTIIPEDEKPDLKLGQSHMGRAYPNPFNARTVIPYHIGGQAALPVQIEVFNVRGQRVLTLFRGMRQPGNNTVIWDGRDERGGAVASGIYFCRLAVPGYETSTKIALVR
jgi:hypothetical protein